MGRTTYKLRPNCNFIKLFPVRKIVLPYKKTSKKLKEMETEQGKIETMLVEMDSKLTDSIEDLSRLE